MAIQRHLNSWENFVGKQMKLYYNKNPIAAFYLFITSHLNNYFGL